jgi:hypothetical protein
MLVNCMTRFIPVPEIAIDLPVLAESIINAHLEQLECCYCTRAAVYLWCNELKVCICFRL